MQLSTCANMVLQEFGGAMPENLISFEDAQREFINVRALELQRLGIATTNITSQSYVLNPSSRDALLPPGLGAGAIPAFVELIPFNAVGRLRRKVEIVPLAVLPTFEGARAISFYGTPYRYTLAWDAWSDGDVVLWYDPIEDVTTIAGATDLNFPPAFWPYLIKKAAINVARIAKLKLEMLDAAEFRQNKAGITQSLVLFVESLQPQVDEWAREFQRFKNLDLNAQPRLRRTQDEIDAVGYNRVTGHRAGDFTS